MQLDVQTNGFVLTDSIREYTKRRLDFALNRDDKHVTRVNVRLADINGPRGGVDKRCQIELRLAGKTSLVVEDTETDLYAAIDRASERCSRSLNRRLERAREHTHKTVTLLMSDAAEQH